jgi:hypothetical protein
MYVQSAEILGIPHVIWQTGWVVCRGICKVNSKKGSTSDTNTAAISLPNT